MMKNNTVARRESGSNLRGDRGGCCWESLGDDAKAAARRASVDYAGRVAEPSLRRARVRREREGARRVSLRWYARAAARRRSAERARCNKFSNGFSSRM